MRLDDLDYDLPEDRIATAPAEPRDQARLMVVRADKGTIEDCHVSDLPGLLEGSDVIVRNASRVLPARLEAHRVESGGRVSGLYLHQREDGHWVAMLRSNGRLRPGVVLQLENDGPTLELVEREDANWVLRPDVDGPAESVLARHGLTPLPPYILRARGEQAVTDEQDREWYQTIYARETGSVAAPTAGLHFTPGLEARLRELGLSFLEVVLHVGAGTFQPVTAPTLAEHRMHSESFFVDHRTISEIMAPDRPGRIVAVGTTTARVLESFPAEVPSGDWAGSTSLMISPPWEWKHVDVLMTNFHLPRSTLLALVAARIGVDLMHEAYARAVESGYRFYSYGDAMLLL
ncbi:MAG: tRNA preQ1(34) S-adenosylmethionine ribosyltransferase-isomerase QueA [Phycisphaerales bacterium]|nr:tRNA preQ1(34) S-adenosylmethionine ribosyltransferase-isomerase QueA [Phycisphaerales bacterium]